MNAWYFTNRIGHLLKFSEPVMEAQDHYQEPMSAGTDARIAPHAAGRPFPPSRARPATPRKPRAEIRTKPQARRASVCSSAAAFRSGFIPLCAPFQPPLHFPACRHADRSRIHGSFFVEHSQEFRT